MTFKSDRAAKMAVTKATNAYEAARDARIGAEWAQRDGGSVEPTADEAARLDVLRAAKDAARGTDGEGEAIDAFYALWDAIRNAPVNAAKSVEDAAWDTMRATYDAAKAQGFWTRCYHLNYNPTRDLIAMNMD